MQMFRPVRAPDPEGSTTFITKTSVRFACEGFASFFVSEIGLVCADILAASYVERIKIGTKIDSIAAGVSRFTTNSAIALVERNWL